jgi:hypothetical protein
MIPNHSLWIKRLNRTRPIVPFDKNVSADIAVVGVEQSIFDPHDQRCEI